MSTSIKGFHLVQPAPAWTAILGLIIFSALCVLVHAGGVLRIAFPAGAFAVGVFLYWRYPILYLGFMWWIWFLTPWVRRLVDYRSGWVDPSPILLAPPLVTLITLATLLRYLPQSYRQGSLPFILSLVGVFYSFLVGLIKNSPTAVILSLLGWLAPILLGFHLFINWRDYPSYRQNIQRTFLWGVLVTGAYGVLQYLIAPEWDRFWLSHQDTFAFGIPQPLGIRVFSTMNSPQPFAVVMMAGLLLLFSGKAALNFPAAGVGYLAFLLSSARSAWLGWLVGLLIFLPSLKAHLQMRLVVTILVMVLCVIPLTTMQPFSDAINSRLQTFSNTKQDDSYRARSEGYNNLLGRALSEVSGQGIGSVINSDSLGSNDSGILSIFFSMGWFGTVPYLGGIVLILFSILQYAEARFDPFMNVARAISLGVFVQIGLNPATVAVFGMIFWGFLGISMAAHKYYWNQQTAELRDS